MVESIREEIDDEEESARRAVDLRDFEGARGGYEGRGPVPTPWHSGTTFHIWKAKFGSER